VALLVNLLAIVTGKLIHDRVVKKFIDVYKVPMLNEYCDYKGTRYYEKYFNFVTWLNK